MITDVDISEALRLQAKRGLVILDTRSPGEYASGHIPEARQLPLFSDDERAQVGTTYKQIDPRQALLEGLEFVGPKMRWLVEEAGRLSEANFSLSAKPAVIVHCWRGGLRSGAVSWLLDMAGLDVYRIEGGYKAYRQHSKAYFDKLTHRLNVVDGPTGSGKTVLLHELKSSGAQVLDLEAIANHKGSAFGLTPGTSQPSTEQAQNDIFAVMQAMKPDQPVWVENESRNIGKVFLPDGLVEALARGHRVVIELPIEDRVEHIVQQYGRYKRDVLAGTFHHLRKRLGGKDTQDAVAAVDRGDLHTAARIALRYYDKAYAHYSERQGHPSSEVHQVRFDELGALAMRLAQLRC